MPSSTSIPAFSRKATTTTTIATMTTGIAPMGTTTTHMARIATIPRTSMAITTTMTTT